MAVVRMKFANICKMALKYVLHYVNSFTGKRKSGEEIRTRYIHKT